MIDIRAMQALIGGRSGGEPKQAGASRDEKLPSFGGGFNGLSATPLLTPTPVAPAPAQHARAPSKLLYVIAGALGLAILGLGAVLVRDPPRSTRPHQAVVVAPPSVVDEPELEANPAPAEVEPEQSDEPGAAAAAEPDAPKPASEAGKAAKPRARSRTPKQGSGTNPAKVVGAATSEAKQTDGRVDVDCLLGEDLPKCKRGGSGGRVDDTYPEPTDPKPKPVEQLPNKLSQSQISAGLGPVKTAAKSCGSGTTVEIKFSVAGATGNVVSATPLGEHGSSAVGRCVAKAAKAATFSRFAAGQQGFRFNFRL